MDFEHNHIHEHTRIDKKLILEELACHMPYAVYAVSLCLGVLSFLTLLYFRTCDPIDIHKVCNALFHNFHFMHIVFAGTGAIITFAKYSKNWFKGIIVGSICAMFFCVLSDILMPYIGGRILGANMDLHICFFHELRNIVPFLVVGVANGMILASHHISRQQTYSVVSHFVHIFVSSLASVFYLVGHGFLAWHKQIGMVFILLLLAVVIPCTLSDIVVPLFFAKNKARS
jgi:hypothetical protein